MAGLHLPLILKMLALIGTANGVPLLAKALLGERWMVPLDGGARFFDRRPLLGPSKSLRGILLALLATTLAAPLLGLAWTWGLLVGAASMAGDLLSSFIKRRLHLPPSSMATGLDQIPESLFPALLGRFLIGLTVADVVAVVVVFFAAEVLLSRLFYRLHLRDRPY